MFVLTCVNLERIFSNPSARSNARLERWALKLQPYHFTITYSPGKTNPADYLSRHPLATTGPSTASDQAKEYIAFLAHHTTPKAITTSEVKEHTRQDPTLQTVMTALRNNSWSSVLASPDPSTNSNENCSIFCATIVPHPIPLPEFPLLSFFLDINSS